MATVKINGDGNKNRQQSLPRVVVAGLEKQQWGWREQIGLSSSLGGGLHVCGAGLL